MNSSIERVDFPSSFTNSALLNKTENMAAFQAYHVSYNSIWCSSPSKVENTGEMNLDHVKHNGTTSISIDNTEFGVTTCSLLTSRENGHNTGEQIHENIPTKKLCDPYPQTLMVKKYVGYRQGVVVRSCEVIPDKTATIESILNLLQETALNHVGMSGLFGDEFGATYGMTRNDLIWAFSRMHLQIDHQPIWGEVSEIDTWVGASGKHKIRRDWQIQSLTTGLVYAHATRYSTWVKPHQMRAGIHPRLNEKRALVDGPEKIENLDDNVNNVNSNLKVWRGDLDMNSHVNNVSYVQWMLETIEDEVMEEENHWTSIIAEYRKECGSSDILQSISDPDEFGTFDGVEQTSNDSLITKFLLPSESHQENGLSGSLKAKALRFRHLLKTGELKNEEIVRARTCQTTVIDGFTIVISTGIIIMIIIIANRRGFIIIIIIIIVVLAGNI